jgi:adenylate cyclase
VLRDKVKTTGGKVVKTLGDGMVCQFQAADAAFRAACEMQAAAVAVESGDEPKLTIKIGFTWGPVVTERGDVFGDTVNVCARLVALASPEQVFTTQETRAALSPGLRKRCRELYPVQIKGRVGEVNVCDVQWRADPDVTKAFDRKELERREWVLELAYAGQTLVVQPSASIKIGRGKTNEIVVNSSLASRVHARIFGRGGNFVIADQSSNGTFVMVDGSSREVRLRREETMLGERGTIGLGGPASAGGEHVLRYRLEGRKAG